LANKSSSIALLSSLAAFRMHVYVGLHTMYHIFFNIVYLCDCYCTNLATGYYMK